MCAQNTTIYPQAKPFVEGDQAPFLDEPLIAKLCTHNQDGTIHIAPIYFGTDGDDILLGTQEMTHKVNNIQRDPRVTVLVDQVDPYFKGVIVYGTATLEYENVIQRRVAIFRKYKDEAGAQATADRLASTWTPVIIRVKPEQTITFDYGQGFGIDSNGDSQGEDIF
jgi:PPOX class probable F420-dependent enzyme